MRSALPIAVAAIVALAVLLPPDDARAWHDEEFGVTYRTARTLGARNWRLGLARLDYGISDRLDIGTYHIPWLLRVPSVFVRWNVWNNDRWAITPDLGLVWFGFEGRGSDDDEEEASDEEVTGGIAVIPFTLAVTYDPPSPWALSWEAIYTKVGVSGDDGGEVEGAVAVTNLQLTSTVEFRISQRWALYLHGRYLAYQNTTGTGSYVSEIDPYTEIEVHGGAETDALDVEHAFGVVPGVQFAARRFHLNVGVGYGNISVPGVNFVIPDRTVYPMLELYWIWGPYARQDDDPANVPPPPPTEFR